MKKIEDPRTRKVLEYLIITAAIEVMTVGIYFFKFPNHFAFGGVSGFSTVLSEMTGITASNFTSIVNYGLLVLGFISLGKEVGIKTVYATVLMNSSLAILEKLCPLSGPLTNEPLLELLFAIACPAIGSAILFNISASSGGTDIIAMILKKHTSINIGTALLLVDITSVVLAFFVFGPATGLFSLLGLIGKSFGIDGVIENLNLCKCFTIVCDNPEPICRYIMENLQHGATIYHAEGAYTHHQKVVVMTTVKPSQAVRLRNFVRMNCPGSFIQITNSSEIIGKGFLAS